MIGLPFLQIAAVIAAVFFSCSVLAADTSTVNVKDFGAKADSVTDDTAAFNAAFDAVKEKCGTVFVPSGNYLIKTHLEIPRGVTLEGIWNYPPADLEKYIKDNKAVQGSTLLAVEGAGSEAGTPFITMKTNSTLKGISIYYPEQTPDNLHPYPWCIGGDGVDIAILDCMLVNPWQGVDLGTKSCDRHMVRNVYGMPLRRGLFVDKCFDIGRIENVHFWPFWNTWGWTQEQGKKIEAIVTGQGEAFIFARTDWEYVTNTFSWGYKIGYHFTTSKDGGMNGNLLGIGADATEIAVLVDNCNSIGLLITNGEFVSFAGEKPTEVVVKDTNDGVVQFQNCAFWGPAHQNARIAGRGTVSFNNCNFVHWDANRLRVPAIEVFGGNLLVNGCNFQDPSSPQIALRGSTVSAVVVGNRMTGPLQVSSIAKADLQMGFNTSAGSIPRPKVEKGAIVIDDSDLPPATRFTGKWNFVAGSGSYYKGTRWAFAGKGEAKAVFTPNVPKAGEYTVYVFFGPDPAKDHAIDAPVTVKYAGGTATKRFDINKKETGSWIEVGTYSFKAGKKGSITLSNDAKGNVLADAVKLVPVKTK